MIIKMSNIFGQGCIYLCAYDVTINNWEKVKI